MPSARSGPSSSATTRNGSWNVTTIARRARSARSYRRRREQDRNLSREPGPLQSRHECAVNSVKFSSLHAWPAGRPLAACRSAVAATLLPDPAHCTSEMSSRYASVLDSGSPDVQRSKLQEALVSIAPWGSRLDSTLSSLHDLIIFAHEGHPPTVLDMFAGGG